MTLPDTAIHFFEDSRGIYIPQNFAETIDRDSVTGVTEREWRILEAGPPESVWATEAASDEYWDTWDTVMQRAVITDSDGTKHQLFHDGDLWLVPIDAEWPEPESITAEDIFIP
jgi:hypothetical protein